MLGNLVYDITVFANSVLKKNITIVENETFFRKNPPTIMALQCEFQEILKATIISKTLDF